MDGQKRPGRPTRESDKPPGPGLRASGGSEPARKRSGSPAGGGLASRWVSLFVVIETVWHCILSARETGVAFEQELAMAKVSQSCREIQGGLL
jgi:hypothetical protein